MPSPFYPLNFYVQRAHARAALKQVSEIGANIDPKQSEAICLGELLPVLQKYGWSPQTAFGTAIASEEMQGLLALIQWAVNGKHLYSISKELVQAFSLSDCGQMSVSDVIGEPFNFYMHFEEHSAAHIVLPGGATLEGAYVFHVPRVSTRIVLCGRQANVAPLDRWKERYNLRIPAIHTDLAADEAIDLALALDLQDLQQARAQFVAQGKNPSEVSMLIDRMVSGREAYAQAMQLVLNALAYKKGYTDDQKVDWPPEAPERLVRQTASESIRERQRGASKLLELGFIPVTYVGKLFAHTVVRNDGQQHKKAHWRRGHWRNQFFGEARAQRKLIWLRPTLVGQAQLQAEE